MRNSRLSLVRLSGVLQVVTYKNIENKNKPRVDYEPRSAHGHAVKNSPFPSSRMTETWCRNCDARARLRALHLIKHGGFEWKNNMQ